MAVSAEAEQYLHDEKMSARLMEACGQRQVAPAKPFKTLHDFRTHMMTLFPHPAGEQFQHRERAIKEAEHGNVAAAAQCVGNCIHLAKIVQPA